MTYIVDFACYARDPLCHILPELTQKVLFMIGEHDWIKRDVPEQMLREDRLTKGSRLVTFGKSGHYLHIEQASQCAIEVMG